MVVVVDRPRPPAVIRGAQEEDPTDISMSNIFKDPLKKSTRFPRPLPCPRSPP